MKRKSAKLSTVLLAILVCAAVVKEASSREKGNAIGLNALGPRNSATQRSEFSDRNPSYAGFDVMTILLPFAPQQSGGVKPGGRVKPDPNTTYSRSDLLAYEMTSPFCEAAMIAKARNNPAFPGLLSKCQGEIAHFKTWGETYVTNDADLATFRNAQPNDSARRGFDIGIGAAWAKIASSRGTQVIQAIHDSLPAAEQGGFTFAVNNLLARNRKGLDAFEKAQNDLLAIKGQAIADQDPLASELRNQQLSWSLCGFDIGMAVAEIDTEPGSGKKQIHDCLPTLEQPGFDAAVSFSLARNKHGLLAAVGAAIAESDATVVMARNAEIDVLYRQGFDIASGLFGDPAKGTQGSTMMGPGATAIRDSLSEAGRRGFNDSVKLHLSRTYTR